METLKLEVTKEVSEQMEIQLPYFCKYAPWEGKTWQLIKASKVDDKVLIEVVSTKDFKIGYRVGSECDLKDKEPATELEFQEALIEVVKHIKSRL
jgi:hypothetical protein